MPASAADRQPTIWPRLGDLPAVAAGDQVELKTLIRARSWPAVTAALHAAAPSGTAETSTVRLLYFFDTAALGLLEQGVIVRARRTRHGHDDVTIKLRRTLQQRTGQEIGDWAGPDLRVEYDALPNSWAWSAALRRRFRHSSPLPGLLAGRVALGDVLTPDQRRLYTMPTATRLLPALDQLRPLGPARVNRRRLDTLSCGTTLFLETCLYPDGSGLIEVSAKCPLGRADPVARELTALLTRRDICPARRQRTKTRATSEFFTAAALADV